MIVMILKTLKLARKNFMEMKQIGNILKTLKHARKKHFMEARINNHKGKYLKKFETF